MNTAVKNTLNATFYLFGSSSYISNNFLYNREFRLFLKPTKNELFFWNFRTFQKISQIQNWSNLWALKIKLLFVHVFTFNQLFSVFSTFLSDWFQYNFHKFTWEKKIKGISNYLKIFSSSLGFYLQTFEENKEISN